MPSKSLWSKLLILGVVTIVILGVLTRIGFLVDERQGRQREAERNVAQAQAGEQVLLGPLVQRTCTESWEEVSGSGTDRRVTRERRSFTLSAAPSHLAVDGQLKGEARYRGLFKVNGYAGQIAIQAQWASLADLTPKAERGGAVQCEPARVMVAVSDARGLRSVQIKRGTDLLAVRPGTRHESYERGLHALLPEQPLEQPLQLSIAMQLIGMTDFGVVPAAATSVVSLRSDWPHPSFGGRFLPSTREVTDAGFSARWEVSDLATNAVRDVLAGRAVAPGSAARGPAAPEYDIDRSSGTPTPRPVVDSLNVALLDPVNPYVMSDRAIKYGLMFIVLTFVCVGVLELLAGRRVHPVQYLLVGLAMSLFFLLLLSLSEHLAFALSYGLAAGAVVALLGFYGASMLGSALRGGAFGGLIAVLYGALYVLLSLEQASLLLGALMLFAVLAVVMTLTRRIDWYAFSGRAVRTAETLTP